MAETPNIKTQMANLEAAVKAMAQNRETGSKAVHEAITNLENTILNSQRKQEGTRIHDTIQPRKKSGDLNMPKDDLARAMSELVKRRDARQGEDYRLSDAAMQELIRSAAETKSIYAPSYPEIGHGRGSPPPVYSFNIADHQPLGMQATTTDIDAITLPDAIKLGADAMRRLGAKGAGDHPDNPHPEEPPKTTPEQIRNRFITAAVFVTVLVLVLWVLLSGVSS